MDAQRFWERRGGWLAAALTLQAAGLTALGGCGSGGGRPEPTPSPTPAPTASPAPTTSPAPTPTPGPGESTPTPTPTPSPVPTATPVPTPTPSPTPTPEPTPTPVPTPTPTPVPTPTPDPFAGVREYLTIDTNFLDNYANPSFPVHYDNNVRQQNNIPPGNPVTDKGATLGRVLFHDKRLSVNGTISCASCHAQSPGFTDTRQFSAGFNGGLTTAHGMRLGNIRFSAPAMFWDKRAASVEAQATQPIQNAVEMGFDASNGGLSALFTKMNTLPYYPELFRWVYGDSTITEDRIQRALAQYERSMISVNSKFDTEFARVFNPAAPGAGIGTRFAGYTDQEERGKQLFITPPNQGGGGCVGCHTAPTFSLAANSRSNGLDAGESRIFKSPSLKNLLRGGPYMHDGRFSTIEQVVDHYIGGIQNGPALDNRLKGPNNQPLRLNFSGEDRDALVAFLKTLDDPTLTTDPKFTNPFKK